MKKPKILLFSMAAFLFLIPAKSASALEVSETESPSETITVETEAAESPIAETETPETETAETQSLEAEAAETQTPAETTLQEMEIAETQEAETIPNETVENISVKTDLNTEDSVELIQAEENITAETFAANKGINTDKYENQDVCSL